MENGDHRIIGVLTKWVYFEPQYPHVLSVHVRRGKKNPSAIFCYSLRSTGPPSSSLSVTVWDAGIHAGVKAYFTHSSANTGRTGKEG